MTFYWGNDELIFSHVQFSTGEKGRDLYLHIPLQTNTSMLLWSGIVPFIGWMNLSFQRKMIWHFYKGSTQWKWLCIIKAPN